MDHVDTWQLVRRGGRWVLPGGGSSSVGVGEALADRPRALPVTGIGSHPGDVPHLAVEGSDVTRDDRGGRDLWPWSGRWVRSTTLRAGAQVAALDVDGRSVEVPWHGRIAVAWQGRVAVAWLRRSPVVTALDAGGDRLARLGLPR